MNKISPQNILKFLQNIIQSFSPKKLVVQDNPPKKEDVLLPSMEAKPEISRAINIESNNCFLICPVYGNDENGKPLTSRTVKIISVLDHSDTAIDPASQKSWGLNAKDKIVKAFNGEVGDGESSAEAPYGYAKKIPTPFFSAKEINYVGSPDERDKYGPTYYLNYDGHAGYDFKCPEGTKIIAPADGELYKAQIDSINGCNRTWCKKQFGTDNPTAWQGWHAFYIKHLNGFSSWFLHCVNLFEDIEKQLDNDYQKFFFVKQGQAIAYSGKHGGVPPHLHFEIRDKEGKIKDPYADKLWVD